MINVGDRGQTADSPSPAVWDVVQGVLQWRLWAYLGLQDIRTRYRRSTLGPLWLTLGLGVTVIGIGLLYSEIINTSPREYLPYIAISFLVWNFIQLSLTEATALYLIAHSVISSVKVPYTSFVLRLIVRNLIAAAHGVVVVVATFIWFQRPVSPMAFASVLGVLLLCANMYWMTLLVALLSARWRDMAQIVIYAIGIAFFLTPIVWLPTAVRPGSPFLHLNPFSQLLATIRDPIYSGVFPTYAMLYSAVLLVVGMTVTLFVFARSRRFLIYWI